MKKFIIYCLKPLSFLPALAVMYMIFSFSGQTGTESGSLSHEISYQIVSVADKILNKNLTENEKQIYTDRIEHPVRKLAHMTEILYSGSLCFFSSLCIWCKRFSPFPVSRTVLHGICLHR